MPFEDVTLRPGTPGDLEFLFALAEASLGPWVEQTYGAWDRAEQRERFIAGPDPREHRIVERGGQPIGCLLVKREEDAIRLQRVFLLPAFQDQGIGAWLTRGVLAEARGAGLPVRLRVFRVNPARRLYERLGFVKTGESETHVLMEHAAGG